MTEDRMAKQRAIRVGDVVRFTSRFPSFRDKLIGSVAVIDGDHCIINVTDASRTGMEGVIPCLGLTAKLVVVKD